MKTPDVDRIRSEQGRSLADFLHSYNENLPTGFPQATAPYLREFKKVNPQLFKAGSDWSLDQHRKKVMDWLPGRVKTSLP